MLIDRLLNELRKRDDVVESASVTNASTIKVIYKTDIVEEYTTEHKKGTIRVGINDLKVKYDVPINYLYEAGFLGATKYHNHKFIARKDYTKANAIERRIALHRLVQIIQHYGFSPYYPPSVLRNNIATLKKYDIKLAFRNNVLQMSPYTSIRKTNHAGRQLGINLKSNSCMHLYSHYFARFDEYIWNRFALYSAFKTDVILKVLMRMRRARKLLSTQEFYATLYSIFLRGTTFYNPISYAALFDKLNAKSVLDLHPESGAKALACVYLDIPYYTIKNHNFDCVLQTDFPELTNLKHRYMTKNDKVDVLIGDGYFRRWDYKMAKPYTRNANNVLLYLSDNRRKLLKMKPRLVLKVSVSILNMTQRDLLLF